MYMMMFVLDDPNLLDHVLEAWAEIGVTGVTILESTGLHRRRAVVHGARYAFAFPVLAGTGYDGHFTLFSTVPDLDTVDACSKAAESVVGPLNAPNTGMLVAWRLDVAHGTDGATSDALRGESGAESEPESESKYEPESERVSESDSNPEPAP